MKYAFFLSIIFIIPSKASEPGVAFIYQQGEKGTQAITPKGGRFIESESGIGQPSTIIVGKEGFAGHFPIPTEGTIIRPGEGPSTVTKVGP